MNIDLETTFIAPEGATEHDFEAFLELVIEELEKIERDDIEMVASLATSTVTFSLYDGEETSTDDFLAAVRTALHAANCATPGWEKTVAALRAESVELAPA